MIELITPKIADPYLRLVCNFCGYSTSPYVVQSGGADGLRRRLYMCKGSGRKGRRRNWPVVHKSEKGYWSENLKGIDLCSDYCKERYGRQRS